jgi:hypothetical protein
MSKDRQIGRRGGGSKWNPRIVQLVCKMLLNGSPPSSIPANIVLIFAVLGIQLEEVPSARFCRQCRTTCQVITETLAAFRVGNAKEWLQAYFDGTGRRQMDLTNFIIGIPDKDNNIMPVVLSCSIFAEDGTSVKQVEAIMDMVSVLLTTCQ